MKNLKEKEDKIRILQKEIDLLKPIFDDISAKFARASKDLEIIKNSFYDGEKVSVYVELTCQRGCCDEGSYSYNGIIEESFIDKNGYFKYKIRDFNGKLLIPYGKITRI